MTKMGPPGRGKGRASAVCWVSGELVTAVALTAVGFLISHGADPRVPPHTQATRTRKGRHMRALSCYFHAPDDLLMHAHLRRHDSAAQELAGGGRVGRSRGPTCLAELTCQGSGVRSLRGNRAREGGRSAAGRMCPNAPPAHLEPRCGKKAGRASQVEDLVPKVGYVILFFLWSNLWRFSRH